MEDTIKQLIDKFNRSVKKDEKLQKELEGLVRTVQIEITDAESYHFKLDNKEIVGFEKGSVENPDVRIMGSAETLKGLINGEIRPMKALATKQVQIKASLQDMLALRKLF